MTTNLLGGRYQILSPLRAGGMGEVILAHDTGLERRVAVKLPPASAEADHVARSVSVARPWPPPRSNHPFICKIHEIGDAGGRLFIVMEYVEGETLHVSVRSGSCYKCSNCGTTSGCAYHRLRSLELGDRGSCRPAAPPVLGAKNACRRERRLRGGRGGPAGRHPLTVNSSDLFLT